MPIVCIGFPESLRDHIKDLQQQLESQHTNVEIITVEDGLEDTVHDQWDISIPIIDSWDVGLIIYPVRDVQPLEPLGNDQLDAIAHEVLGTLGSILSSLKIRRQ